MNFSKFQSTLRRVIIYIYIFFSFQIIAMLASSSSSSSSFNSTLLAQSSKGIGCFNLRKLVVYFVNRLAILCENTRRRASVLQTKIQKIVHHLFWIMHPNTQLGALSKREESINTPSNIAYTYIFLQTLRKMVQFSQVICS